MILYDHADRTTTVRRQAAEWEQIRHCLRHEREARKVGEFEVVWCDAHDGQEVAVLAAAKSIVMDHRSMVRSASSFARVPLGEVLPRDYIGAERELRRLANELDSHPSATDRSTWHWYPGQREPSQPSPGSQLLLVDDTITLYDIRQDWLELTLDIAWLEPPKLTVNAAIEVACWCPQNHNMHQVRTAQWHAANSRELVEAFAAGTAMLTDFLGAGPFDPHGWRVQAGLPDASQASK